MASAQLSGPRPAARANRGMSGRGTEQVPFVARDVEEHGDAPVGLCPRCGEELHAGCCHALVGGVEVVGSEEEPRVLPGEPRSRTADQ